MVEAREHADDAKQFVEHVERELDVIDSILIVGPASAKLEVFTAALNPRLLVSRTADHPTEREIIERARSYFRQATGG